MLGDIFAKRNTVPILAQDAPSLREAPSFGTVLHFGEPASGGSSHDYDLVHYVLVRELKMSDLPQTQPGVPAPGIDPTVEELAGITTVDLAFRWLGTSEAARRALLGELGGGTTPALRDIVYIKAGDWQRSLDNIVVSVPDAEARAPTVIEMGHFHMLRRICRLRCGLPAVEVPPAPQAQRGGLDALSQSQNVGDALALLSQASTTPQITGEPEIKLSLILDPNLDSKLVRMPQTKVRALFTDYIAKRGAEPSEDIEPTLEQISAVYQVCNADLVPYADFSILGPHGRRMVGKLSYCAYTQQPDGSWHRRELPGPPTWDHWWSSFRVLRTIYLLLDIAEPEILDNYGEMVRAFANLYGPKAWFVVYTADVRMRSEHFERLRRKEERLHEAALKSGATSLYNPAKPWKRVFAAAIDDCKDWWESNLHRPALLYLTSLRTAAETVADGTVQQLTDLPRERSRIPPARDQKQKWQDDQGGVYTKAGRRFCDAYNTTAGCSQGNRCTDHHACKRCRLPGHGMHECSSGRPPKGSKGKQRPPVRLVPSPSSSNLPPPPPPSGSQNRGGQGNRGSRRNR